jgi:PAS domain S-box-containing protein
MKGLIMKDIKILIVEDEWIVAKSIKKILEHYGYEVLSIVDTGEDAIKKSRELKPHIILMDIVLKGKIDGIDAAIEIKKQFNIPVIYLTANADENTFERAKISEPFGYIVKPFQERELQICIEIAHYKHKSEMEKLHLATAMEQINESIVITDTNGIIEYVNPAFENTTGYTYKETLEQHNSLDKNDFNFKDISDKITTGEIWNNQIKVRKRDGTKITLDSTFAPIKDINNKIINYIGILRDVTEKIKIERHLRNTQKLEALGALAGGIAHDFNNILSVIMGYTELLEQVIPKETEEGIYLEEIFNACEHARELTKQILTFSRRDESELGPIKLIPILKESIKLISNTLPKSIKIIQKINMDYDLLIGDPSQIYQVIMNLIINASHAIGDNEGLIEIILDDIFIEENNITGLKAGNYIELSIKDTGCGISQDIIDKIFEPFFTTKNQGEGSGMGLFVVHGIIKKHNGAISVFSEPASGSIFQVLLPKSEEKIMLIKERRHGIPMGQGRILFVDDNEDIIYIQKKLLREIGYDITVRKDGMEALDLFRKQQNYDLIITNYSMPNMSGIELSKEIFKINPHIPVILCTGYKNKITGDRLNETGIKEIVMKPVLLRELAVIIDKVLHQSFTGI